MGTTAAVHPADPILQAYGLGKLDDAPSASVSQHLESCDSCRQRVAALSSDDRSRAYARAAKMLPWLGNTSVRGNDQKDDLSADAKFQDRELVRILKDQSRRAREE